MYKCAEENEAEKYYLAAGSWHLAGEIKGRCIVTVNSDIKLMDDRFTIYAATEKGQLIIFYDCEAADNNFLSGRYEIIGKATE